MIEILGYVATVIVIFSFTIRNLKWLRIVNTIGCFLFTIYGLLILSMPIIITNTAIMIINLYQILKTFKKVKKVA
jgi:uncharacterized protein with PQ loop repeat